MKDLKLSLVTRRILLIVWLGVFLLTQACSLIPKSQSSTAYLALMMLFSGGVTTSTGNSAISKDISSFQLAGQIGVIGTNSIGVTLPYGSRITALIATFEHTGKSALIGSTVQTSGISANDFSAPIVYTVLAENGSTKDYTVTVEVADGSAKDFMSYSILGQAGTIGATSIGVIVPFGTNLASLVATFTISGASVNINGTNQVSSTTANDFSTAKTYTIIAANGTTKNYTVTVVVAQSSAKDITAFSILGQSGTIGANSVGVTVPYGTNPNGLVATFTISGASVNINGTNQVSATTANDFTSAVSYTVVAADGSTKAYSVTLSVAANPAKDITAFSILGQAGTIGVNSIGVTVPYGTNPNGLVATFTISGASVNINGTNQVSATTVNDFTSAVSYTVVAADMTTKTYIVTVTVAASPAKDLTAFSILGQAGTIGANSVGVTVPYGTNPNGLVATFTISGASVNINGTNQVSATTANDFSSAKTYTVVAADGSTKAYTVTVSIAASPAKDITAFSILGQAGTIGTDTINVNLPSGTSTSSLVSTFTISGASVNIGGSNQVSATTANDFSSSKTYTVVAADGTSKSYTVTVNVLADILWRSLASSSDGVKLVSVSLGNKIFTSVDSGLTWTSRESDRQWYSVASSSDGAKLTALAQNSFIFTSTDSGDSWTARESSRNWISITSSADGTKLAAVEFGGQIYTSIDSGLTWTARESSRNWFYITSSSDGVKLAAIVNNGQIYTSTDSGVTWTPREEVRIWIAITSSADGIKLAAVDGNRIYTSTDSGETWTARESTRNWRGIASSADGTKLVAHVQPGQIYTSTDSGVTWQVRY